MRHTKENPDQLNDRGIRYEENSFNNKKSFWYMPL